MENGIPPKDPSGYHRTASAMMEYHYVYPSPLGPLTISSDGENITGIRCDYTIEQQAKVEMIPPIRQAVIWLDDYFSGKGPKSASLPLSPKGTLFQETVWKLLLQVPYGESITYGQLARQAAASLGRERMSAQAVGGAVGKNPILIVIPCHRVLGSGGAITGFSAGIDRKVALLRLENISFKA